MGASCSTRGRDEKYDIFVGRLEGGLDSFGSGQGPVAGSCEDDNEVSGSIICGEFLD
jgi:hypothetical protein